MLARLNGFMTREMMEMMMMKRAVSTVRILVIRSMLKEHVGMERK